MEEKLSKLLKLYRAGKISFCTLINSLVGPNTENLSFFSNASPETMWTLVELAEDFKSTNLACLDNFILMLSEGGDKYALVALAKISKSIGFSAVKKNLEIFKERGFIDPLEGLRSLIRDNRGLSEEVIGSLLIITLGTIPSDLTEVLVNKLKQSESEIVQLYLDIYKALKAEEKEAETLVESVFENLQNCIVTRDKKCIFRQLSILQAASTQLENYLIIDIAEQKDLDHKLLSELLNVALLHPINVLEANLLVFYMDLFAEKLDFRKTLMVIEKIVLEKLYDKLDILSNVIVNTRNVNRKYLVRKALSVRASDNVFLRELYVTILYKFVEEGSYWALKPLRHFCRDKRSSIREKCANALIEFIDKEGEIDARYVKAIIGSKNTKAIARLLNIIKSKEVEGQLLEYIINSACKIPRISIASILLSILEVKWNKLKKETILRCLKRLSYLSIGKKNLRSRLYLFLTQIASRSEDKEFIHELSEINKNIELDSEEIDESY